MARSLRRTVRTTPTGLYRGVNLSGLENGETVFPGTINVDFTQNSASYYQYIKRKGFNLVRLPFLWERIQPDLNGDLDTTYKGYIDNNISWAADEGLAILLDVHNYGRRNVAGNEQVIGDGTLTQAHFVDLWTKISAAYKDNTTVLGYNLMNEPHNMPVASTPTTYKTTATWTLAAQAALNAIRANGDTHIITVNTDWWSSVPNYLDSFAYGSNPDMWITDTLEDKLWLQLHCYFDSTYEGAYANADRFWSGSELDIRFLGDKLIAIGEWAQSKGVTIFLGEYAVPSGDNAYLTALSDVLKIMDQYSMHGCYFALGNFFNASLKSITPKHTFAQDREQMDLLLNHL